MWTRLGRARREENTATNENSQETATLQSLEATAFNRVHTAMLLQISGHSNALRRLIDVELDRGSDFLRLPNALSGQCTKGSEEKRLVGGMLPAVPR